MNVQKLQDTYPNLIGYMRKEEYSESYIEHVVSVIKCIIKNSENNNWTTYEDVYYDYTRYYSKNTLSQKATCLSVIAHFDLYNDYPSGTRKSSFGKKDAYNKLNKNFKCIIDYYCEIAEESKKARNTIKCNKSGGSVFFLYFQDLGCTNIYEINENDVLSYFIQEGVVVKRYSTLFMVKAVLRIGGSKYPRCNEILDYLPKIKSHRKNIQYLTHEEVKRFKNAINDESNSLTLRDRAIGSIIVYTGLRKCDVSNLTIGSFDWKNDIFFIEQQKNGIPLKLPLTATVGNAIYNYITLERKKNSSKYLFISYKRPYGKIGSDGIYDIVNRIMDVASIRTDANDRRGTHIFRHYAATTLISSGVSQPVVSSILGHSHPSSINSYLSADFTNLKCCALSIEKFKRSEGNSHEGI